MRSFVLVLLLSLAALSHAAEARSYTSGKFAFDIGGESAGWVQSVEGGGISAEVREEAGGRIFEKHLGPVGFDAFTVQMGLSMGKPVKDWIDASLSMNYMRKSGELKAADFKRGSRRIREFQDALLTEIGFPACDAASKDVGHITLTFTPQRSGIRDGDNGQVDPSFSTEQKMWQCRDFRLTIDGVDCTEVAAIDAFRFLVLTEKKQDPNGIGPVLVPVRTVLPNLRLTASGRSGAAFLKWGVDFLYEGNNESSKEKTGLLEFLDATRQRTLLAITFKGLGIFSLTPEPEPNDPDKVEAKLYAETATVNDDDPKPPKNQ